MERRVQTTSTNHNSSSSQNQSTRTDCDWMMGKVGTLDFVIKFGYQFGIEIENALMVGVD